MSPSGDFGIQVPNFILEGQTVPEHGYSRRVTRLLATLPGPESGYLLEGELVLLVDGQPPKPLKAGESYGTLPALFTTPKAA